MVFFFRRGYGSHFDHFGLMLVFGLAGYMLVFPVNDLGP